MNNPIERSRILEIANKSPLDFTEDDIKTYTAYLQAQRAKFAKEEVESKAQGRKVNPSAVNLSLDDLDL